MGIYRTYKWAIIRDEKGLLSKGENTLTTKEKGHLSKYKGYLSDLDRDTYRIRIGTLIRGEKRHL